MSLKKYTLPSLAAVSESSLLHRLAATGKFYMIRNLEEAKHVDHNVAKELLYHAELLRHLATIESNGAYSPSWILMFQMTILL